MINLKKLDNSLLILFSALAIASFYQITRPVALHIADSENRTKVASISKLNNTVKKKDNRILAWEDAKQKEDLAYQDQIYTHENSKVTIDFFSGEQVTVNENTLFKITENNHSPLLDIKKGVIYLKLTGQKSLMQVKLGDKNYKLSSKDAEVKITHQKNASQLVVVKGKVDLIEGTSKKALLQNQSITVEIPTPKDIVSDDFITILSPKNQQQVNFEATPNINFKWKLLRKNKKVTLLLSKNKNFQDILLQQKTSKESLQIEKLEAGNYFYKFKYIETNNSTLTSHPKSFSVIEYFPMPILISPADNALISMQTPSQKTNFKWKAKEGKYFLQFSTTQNFEKIVREIESKDLEKGVKGIVPGNYFWRIRYITPKNQTLTTPARSIQVKKGHQIQAPILQKIKKPFEIKLKEIKKKTSFFEKIFNLFISPSHAEDYVKTVTLKWPSVENAKGYRIRVFQGSKVLLDQKTDQNFLDWESPKETNLFWQVASIDAWGDQSPFSQKTALKIEGSHKLSPSLNRPLHGKKYTESNNDSQNFSWQKNDKIDHYRFKLSKSLDFQSPLLNKKLKTNDFNLKKDQLSSGTYYWRVIAVDAGGNEFKSKKRKIVVEKKKIAKRPPPSPKPIELQKFSLSLYGFYNSISYEQTGDYTVDISGSVASSIEILFHQKRSKRSFLTYTLTRTTGEVFTDKSYEGSDLAFGYGRYLRFRKSSLHSEAALLYKRNTSFTRVGSNVEPTTENFFAAGIKTGGTFLKGKRFNSDLFFSFFYGTLMKYRAEILIAYKWSKRLSLSFSANYQGESYEGNSQDISLSEMKFGPGIRYNF